MFLLQAVIFKTMTTTYLLAVNMRKILFSVSVMVVVAAILVSCSQDSSVDKKITESETGKEVTTVLVDYEGKTHYYKVVSDDSQGIDSTTVLVKIVTNKNDEPITNRSGEYVTTEYTTVITAQTTNRADDNEISFENTDITTVAKTDETTSETPTSNGNTSNSTTPSETESKAEPTTPSEPPTDSDGWINRWY